MPQIRTKLENKKDAGCANVKKPARSHRLILSIAALPACFLETNLTLVVKACLPGFSRRAHPGPKTKLDQILDQYFENTP